jgi:hypothetical protein
MYSNICTKEQIIEQFNLWLLHDSELDKEFLNQIIAKANLLLEDGGLYDYRGHQVLLNQLQGV